MSENKLKRITSYNWVGGVCGGFAYYFKAPIWAVRLGMVAFMLLFGFGVLPYVLLWIFMPKWNPTPADYLTVVGETVE